MAHYIIETCLEEQAAEGRGQGSASAPQSEPSGASAQTAGGDAVRGDAVDSGATKATAETSPVQKRASQTSRCVVSPAYKLL